MTRIPLPSRTPPTVLGIDANDDPITDPAFQYREIHVYPYLFGKGQTVEKCQGTFAKKVHVAPKAQLPSVVYITGVGHATQSIFTGFANDFVFEAGNYTAAESNAKIIHLLACYAADTLGPDFVNNGCLAYFGYCHEYFWWEAATSADRDVFFECDSEIDRAFADGLTAAAVFDQVKKLFQQRAADFRADGSDDKRRLAAILDDNLKYLRRPSSPAAPGGGPNAWGDPLAKLP